MTKNKRKWTYGEVLEKLKQIATAKYVGDKKEKIKGNKRLELTRAKEIKAIEDMLSSWVKKTFAGGTYIRSYKHLYPKTKKK